MLVFLTIIIVSIFHYFIVYIITSSSIYCAAMCLYLY